MSELLIGLVVRTVREARGLTREELARRSRVSTSMITRLELKNRLPMPVALGRITAELGLSAMDEAGSPASGEPAS